MRHECILHWQPRLTQPADVPRCLWPQADAGLIHPDDAQQQLWFAQAAQQQVAGGLEALVLLLLGELRPQVSPD